MRKLIKGARPAFLSRGIVSRRSLLSVLTVCAALALLVLPGVAHADPPAGFVDYAALLGTAKTEIQTATTSSMGVVFAVMAGLLGVGIAVRMIKKAAKSS